MKPQIGWETAFLVLPIAVALSCGGRSPASPTPPTGTTQPPAVLTVEGQLTLSRSGATSQLTATARFADGSSRDLTSACAWQSSNAAVVAVSQTGLLRAVDGGTARITATYGGVTSGGLAAVRLLELPNEIPLGRPLLVGSWVNVDPATGGLTRIDISTTTDGLAIHPWGSCVPACDWGEETTASSDGDDGLLSLAWRSPFSVVTVQIRLLKDGRLEAWEHTHFTDNSGRKDYGSADYFRKAS